MWVKFMRKKANMLNLEKRMHSFMFQCAAALSAEPQDLAARQIKRCTLFLLNGALHSNTVLFFLCRGMRCHAAVPPGPGSHGKGAWKGLSSIFSHWQGPNTLKIQDIYTNKVD